MSTVNRVRELQSFEVGATQRSLLLFVTYYYVHLPPMRDNELLLPQFLIIEKPLRAAHCDKRTRDFCLQRANADCDCESRFPHRMSAFNDANKHRRFARINLHSST